MPNLVLVRHGQSEWNLQNRFTGWVDVNLTEEGEAQARKAGGLMKAAGFTRTALILVGRALGETAFDDSALYADHHHHVLRPKKSQPS